jgi:hypothetical protein
VGLVVWWIRNYWGEGRQGDRVETRHRDTEKGRETPISNLQSLNLINRLIPLFLISITALDLFLAHGRFNPASDPALSPWTEQGTPPVVKFINEREGTPLAPLPSPWRFTTFNAPGEKTFNANVGMYYGWQDVRGYDSIIPRQYAELMQQIQPQENELLYNRIAPIYASPAAMSTPRSTTRCSTCSTSSTCSPSTPCAQPRLAGDLPGRRCARLREPGGAAARADRAGSARRPRSGAAAHQRRPAPGVFIERRRRSRTR